MKQALDSGRYSYVPFYCLGEGADTQYPPVMPTPITGAPLTQTTPAPYVQLRAPPFTSASTSMSTDHPTSAQRTQTLQPLTSAPPAAGMPAGEIGLSSNPSNYPKNGFTAPRPGSSISHGSVHTTTSSMSSGRASVLGSSSSLAHHTPAGVASASLRTSSSTGTASTEEATVSNLLNSTTRNITQPQVRAVAAPEVPPATTTTTAMPAPMAVLRRPGMKSPWPGNEGGEAGAQEEGARRPHKFGMLGRPMRVASVDPESAGGSGAAHEDAMFNQGPSSLTRAREPMTTPAPLPPPPFSTPGPSAGMPQMNTAVTASRPSSAARPRSLETPLASISGGLAEATSLPSAAPKQLVLEDGPDGAAEEATARMTGRDGAGAGFRAPGPSLAAISEDPGATVPLSRPVMGPPPPVPAVAVLYPLQQHKVPQMPPQQQQQQQYQQQQQQQRVMQPPPPQPVQSRGPPRPQSSSSKFSSLESINITVRNYRKCLLSRLGGNTHSRRKFPPLFLLLSLSLS